MNFISISLVEPLATLFVYWDRWCINTLKRAGKYSSLLQTRISYHHAEHAETTADALSSAPISWMANYVLPSFALQRLRTMQSLPCKPCRRGSGSGSLREQVFYEPFGENHLKQGTWRGGIAVSAAMKVSRGPRKAPPSVMRSQVLPIRGRPPYPFPISPPRLPASFCSGLSL